MPVAWQQLYADRAQGMRASDIREILKITAQPDVISLAGGLPAPELFPIDEYRRAFEWVLESDGAQALQYGPSEGYRPLRKLLSFAETFAISYTRAAFLELGNTARKRRPC